MTEPEYATFNDPPDKPPTELEKAEAIMAKPWRKLTWKERLFKGVAYTGAVAAGLAAGMAAECAAAGRSGSAGWDNPPPPRPRPNPQSVIQPVVSQPGYNPFAVDPFYNPYVGLADPVGMWRYMNGPQI